MAGANFTKLIEFKVKQADLKRAVDKLFKDLKKVELTVEEINEGTKILTKELNKASKGANALERSLKGVGRHFKGFDLLGKKVGFVGKGLDYFAKRALALDVTARSIKALTKRWVDHGGAIDKAWAALNRYRRVANDVISTHGRLIQSLASVSVSLAAVGQYAPQIYNLGKAFRQLQYDISQLDKIGRSQGFKAAMGSLIPKDNQSYLAKLGRRLTRQTTPAATAATGAPAKTQTAEIQKQVAGLKKVDELLRKAQEKQRSLNAFSKEHWAATIEVRNAQFAFNQELQKSKIIQSALTADVWATKKAWQGITGIAKGAANLFGGLLGGKAGGLGQAAGIIGITRGVEALTQRLGFLNNSWINNANTVALWSARASEAITAVSLAYGGLNTALNAAQWVTGAIGGFVKWEKSAAQSVWNVQRAFDSLDQRMAANLDKNRNIATGFGSWIKNALRGGEERVEEKRTTLQGPTNQQKVTQELKKQERLLANRNTTAADYIQIQQKIIQLEIEKTRETDLRRAASVKAGKPVEEVYEKEVKAADAAIKKIEGMRKKSIQNAIAANNQINQEDMKAAKEKLRLEAAAAKQKEREIKAAQQLLATVKKHNWELRKARRIKRLTQRRERAQAAGRFGESLMLGAGFPLLFGGGIGAVGGGLLGAGLQAKSGSKGFGAQIFLSALGTAVDQFVQKVATLGQAFSDITPDIDALTRALGVAGTATERQIKLLKDSAGEQVALAIATERAAMLVGKNGVKALKEFGSDSQDLANEWTKAMTQMQASLADVINAMGIITALANTLGKSTRYSSAQNRAREGDVEMALLFAQRKGIENRQMPGIGYSLGDWKALKDIDNQIDRLEKKKQLEENLLLLGKSQSATIEGIKKKLQDELDLKRAVTEEDKARLNTAQQYKEILEKFKEAYGDEFDESSLAGIKKLIEELNKVDKKNVDYIGDAMDKWKERLDELKNPAYQLVSAADAIGNAFSDAFKGIVSGSMTAREAFAAFTRSVASHFLDMAAEMAATALRYGIMKMLINAGIGATFNSTGSIGSTGMQGSTLGQHYQSTTDPALNSFRTGGLGMAEGGYVSGPTDAIIGEGGEGEYVIPESKMGDALAKYAGGARGDDVLAGGGGDGEAGGISGGASGSIDVTFNTQVINDVSYVSYSEFQAGVTSAAQQGAKLGEQATLKKLQTSPSVRRRVGV